MSRRASLPVLLVMTAVVSQSVAAVPLATAQPTALDPLLDQAVGWYTGTAGTVDDARAHDLLLAASADHDPLSRMWLARCHSTGRMGFPRDPAQAATIASEVLPAVRALADAGEREALFLMGTAYDEALGVAENLAEAVQWYRRAADLGHVLAQHNLGNLHQAGRGVSKDDSQAVAWWRRAAEQGDAIPMFRLGEMYEAGRGVERDLGLARAWYERAAARGFARARSALARLAAPAD